MRSFPKRTILPVVLVVVLLLAVSQACGPSLRRYEGMRFPADPPETASSDVRVTFLGVSTLLIHDDTTAFMTDGFFTRPPLWRMALARPVPPNEEVIRSTLRRLGLDSLSVPRVKAVIPLHSHYDHVMDAPIVADQLNAEFIGSPSTVVVAQSMDFAGPIDTVLAGDTVQVGGFRVEFIECVHGPPDRWPGVNAALLRIPVPAGHYRTGNCHSLLIHHGGRSILVTGTAGFVPGSFLGRNADVVYLSIGGLGKADSRYRASYWDEVVRATRARRVVLIHWDNLTRPLRKPLTSIPRLEDDLGKTIDQYCGLAVEDRVELRLAREWEAADPFAGMSADTAVRLPGGCPGR